MNAAALDLNAAEPLARVVAASRLLGTNPALVLHGGGNTSIKAQTHDVTGGLLDVVYVKGSGWDLATIEPAGFAPLRRERLLALAQLESLDDPTLVNELRQASLRADAPTASIEAILHAVIPSEAVLHTHADAIVTLTNQVGGRHLVAEVLGEDVMVVDYIKPGFGLAREVARRWAEEGSSATAIVLMNHGLFTFADDMRTAYDRHLALVALADAHLRRAGGSVAAPVGEPGDALAHARLRRAVSEIAQRPMILQQRESSAVSALLAHPSYPELAQRGPITPEHVIRTKRVPCIGDDVAAYAADYNAYVERHRSQLTGKLVRVDPAPRVLLQASGDFALAGDSVAAARIAGDIYEHTATVILRAEHLGGYRTLDERETFDIEYWDLEQAKLARGGKRPQFQGEVAVVTGAASGIGRACALALLDAGAAVIAMDRSESVRNASVDERWFGVVADVTDLEQMRAAIEAGVRRFGGVDMVVAAAGIFAASAPIVALEEQSWSKSMAVNADALFGLFRFTHPYLDLSPRGGRVVVIASKNVPAPGPGAAAYSASKAAATQLARVAALEWGAEGIRVNMVNPDAVFDTGLWTPELLSERAAKYGLSVKEYKRRNVLRTEVTSAHVAAVVRDLCGDDYAATTGAQIPIDGGNDRVV